MSLFGTTSSSGASNNATTSSASAGGGLFGSSTTPAPSSGGLFGSQTQSTPSFSFGNPAGGNNTTPTPSTGTSGGGLFGAAAAKPAEQKPLFGATSNTTSGSATPTLGGGTAGSLFGSHTLTPSGTSMFGSKPAATSTATGAGGLFGSTPAPNATAAITTPTTTVPAASPFAQVKPATNQESSASKPGGLFGGSGTATATGSSLLGGTTSGATSAAQTTPAKPMFPLNSTTPAGAPPANPAKPSGGLFGNTPNTGVQSGSSLFPSVQQGEKKENQPPSLFATQTSSQLKPAIPQPAASLFPAASQPEKPGNSTSLFGATKPAELSSASLFGAKPVTTENAGPKAGTGGLSLFGSQPQSKPAETAAPAQPTSLFGNTPASTASAGSLFPTSTTAAQTSGTSAPATSATKTTSLFGNVNKPITGITSTEPLKASLGTPAPDGPKPVSLFGTAAPAASASTAMTAPPNTSTTAAGGASAPTATTTTTTAAPSTGSVFGTAAKATPSADSAAPKPAVPQTTTLGASTSGPTSSMARLKNRTMDEILNRWATDLSKYQKEFKEQAAQVAAWDRLLVENGDKIQKLYLNTFEAEKASREVERHLVTVESQQEELESWLDKYEVEVDALFSKQIGPGEQVAGPDQERERTYKLAEKITERLDEMSRDLTKMIKEINDISGTVGKGSKSDDPLSQIVRVLNGHLTQLQWIDTNAAALQAKVTAAQKASSQIGNQYGGPEQDNVDSFYRSYMGRR